MKGEIFNEVCAEVIGLHHDLLDKMRAERIGDSRAVAYSYQYESGKVSLRLSAEWPWMNPRQVSGCPAIGAEYE